MEKRILLAFLLSLIVLYGSRLLFPPKVVPPGTEQSSNTKAPVVTPASTQPSRPSEPPRTVPEAEPAVPEGENVQAKDAEDFQVDTPIYTATLSNHGAVLKSFRLKAPYTDAEGHPIELIDAAGTAKIGWPLAIATQDSKLDESISNANFAVKRDGLNVTMQYAASGLQVAKSLQFDPQNYEVSVGVTVSRDGKAAPYSILWQGGFGDQSIPPNPATHQVVH